MLESKKSERTSTGNRLKENIMSWTAPVVVEICAGMEVTAYLTAEL
jgi:coenzyme PQQ precursor peptide PqqA